MRWPGAVAVGVLGSLVAIGYHAVGAAEWIRGREFLTPGEAAALEQRAQRGSPL